VCRGYVVTTLTVLYRKIGAGGGSHGLRAVAVGIEGGTGTRRYGGSAGVSAGVGLRRRRTTRIEALRSSIRAAVGTKRLR
jgi:hypothetical protein